jgi:hypothetical protein
MGVDLKRPKTGWVKGEFEPRSSSSSSSSEERAGGSFLKVESAAEMLAVHQLSKISISHEWLTSLLVLCRSSNS